MRELIEGIVKEFKDSGNVVRQKAPSILMLYSFMFYDMHDAMA